MKTVSEFSYPDFKWWIGTAVDNKDPEKLGRVKIRIDGYHSEEIKDKDLQWAYPMQPITSGALGGVGSSPTGIIKGTRVIGFFADGNLAQAPIIMGTIGGIPESDGKTPNEPDTNRLSRNEKIGETIIQKKRSGLDTGKTAFGGSWKEKATQYAAEYPHCHTYETPNGIVIEVDDTKGAERYAVYHPSGSFVEMHPDGSVVTKATNDVYTIMQKDGYILIKGDAKINVQQNANILVEGDSQIEVKGNETRKILGNMNVDVGGNYNLKVAGNQKSTTQGTEIRIAETIHLNP